MSKSKKVFACALFAIHALGAAQALDDIDHVHPSWTLSSLRPDAWHVQVAGMDFLPGGRLLILEHANPDQNSTNVPKPNGNLYVIDNPSATGEAIRYRLIAQGLHEPVGLLYLNGKVYVSEKNELNEYALDTGFTKATKTRTVATIPHDSKGSVNFQEYSFGPLYKDGYFYLASAGAVKNGGKSFDSLPDMLDEPRVGCLLKIRESDGNLEMVNGGMRADNGISWGPEGTIWLTDNQGSYRPASQLTQIIAGANYGYPNKINAFSSKPVTPPSIWMIHGEIARSPTFPHLVQHGLYAGQFVVGDLSQGGIKRAFVEKVNGAWQGCVFSFTGGLEVGIESILEDSSGTLYVGGFGRGDTQNWGWLGKKWGLQKLVPKAGPAVMEILAIRSRKTGMEIEFTKPVGPEAEQVSSYQVAAGQMAPQSGYGLGSMVNKANLTIKSVRISSDRKKAFLELPDMAANTVLNIKTLGVKSQTGDSVRCPAGWYTLNAISPTDPFTATTGIAGKDPIAGAGQVVRAFASASGIRVEIPFEGPHRISLRTAQGRLISDRSGNGPHAYEFTRSQLREGVLILEVNAGASTFRNVLAF